MTISPIIDGLASQKVIICGGAGGVGKTTTSAALAVALANRTEGRVLVLTVDPARRLASALGLDDLTYLPTDLTGMIRAHAPGKFSGTVAGAMLDVKDAWDRTVRRYSRTPADAERLIRNPFYQSLTTSFVGSQEYAALETLYQLYSGREWDTIVIDTPPSQNALDIIDAPRHYSEFAGAKLIGMLSSPMKAGFRAFSIAALPISKMASVLLGRRSFEELLDFVEGFQYLQAGIQERALSITHLLQSRNCGFVVVTTLEHVQFQEAELFTRRLRDMHMALRGIIVNKALPRAFRAPAFRHAGHVAHETDTAGVLDPDTFASVGAVLELLSARARDEDRVRKMFTELGRAPLAALPYLPRDISNLDGVLELAEHLGSG